ncbi:MAG: right-handed parallel beta-helix repeat-containing protein [Ruminococcus sp.]
MKKIFSLILIIIFALSTITVQGVSGAEIYDITVSDGTEESLQSALNQARYEGTAKDPYVIHVTKSMKISRGLSVYSNTKLVSDIGVVYTRDVPVYEKRVMLRFGDLGSYSSGYNYKNITIQGGVWNGNGTKKNKSFCIFKLAHAQNVKLIGCTFQKDVEGHMVEVGAVNTMTVKKCIFKDHISLDASYEHEEALQLDVNLKKTTEMGNFDKYQNKNITVTGCTFNNVGRGVGSHNSVEGLYFTNMHIDDNIFKNLKSYAIACVNYRNSTIKDNDMLSCGGGILFMNIKNNYKSCTNSYVMKNWKLKLNTKKDNSVISGNTIKQIVTKEDAKSIILFGDQVPANYKDRYIKGDHCINGVTLYDNKVYTPKYTAILLNDAKNCNVKRNKVYYTGKGNAGYGIFLQDKCDGTSVTYNTINKCYDGITATDSNSLKVYDNIITESKRNGITCKGTKRSIFKNNKIENTQSQGMYFERAKASVTNCKIDKVSKNHGITTNSKDCNLKITGCTIKKCNQFGIALSKGKATIKKCKFSGNKKGNIYRG